MFSIINLEKYSTIIFDCDGVVLNSNNLKTQAFYNAALPYGEEAAKALVDHHLANGGISRYKKFEFFLNKLVPIGANGPSIEKLLITYAKEVREGLLACDVAEGLDELREKTKHTNWLIVSGGDQNELRVIFSERGLNEYFDGGIFGSPDSKDKILKRELLCGNIRKDALFLGDSKYDLIAAKRVGLDFIYINKWSESNYPFFEADFIIQDIRHLVHVR